MSAVDETHITVGLFAQRPMRGQCLARYLELSGLGIRIVAENCGDATQPVQPEDAIDITVIDTGEHACSDASIETIFTWLAKAMPGVPIVVVSDRDDGAAVFEAPARMSPPASIRTFCSKPFASFTRAARSSRSMC